MEFQENILRQGHHSSELASKLTNASPLMRQYWDIKANYHDVLLFFRLGDFYELFAEDAYIGAKELEITLTGRPEPSYPNGRVPMAGVPVKAAEVYLGKLLAKGYSVALCEQVGTVGATKGPVAREVTRILTPGTVLETNLLPLRENNYLAALLKGGRLQTSKGQATLWGLAYVEASCGEFYATELSEEDLVLELTKLCPAEILVPKRLLKVSPGQVVPQEILEVPLALSDKYLVKGRPGMFFQLEPAKRRLMQAFQITTLEGFGLEVLPLATGAAAAILEYLETTQARQVPKFSHISTYAINDYLIVDSNTSKNLELVATMKDLRFEGSLLAALDKAKTNMGSRLLRQWLLKPLLSTSSINERQEAIAELTADYRLLVSVSEVLAKFCDLERLAVRLFASTINPRELVALAQSLACLPGLGKILSSCKSKYLAILANIPGELLELTKKISSCLKESPPAEISEGGIFQEGFDEELDEIRTLLGGGKQWLENFQKQEQERTEIRSLKVRFNTTFGYYIEITNANKDAVPADYIRKQTLTNAERYITPQLKEYETKMLNAELNQAQREYKLFAEFRNSLVKYGCVVKEVAKHVAAADVLLALAQVALENRYVRPIVDNSLVLEIKGGRHPVLENILPMGKYVPNDTRLAGESDQQMIILTGPNMSGKSSLLRQVAQIVILAQMGSFVPASFARIGLVDRIFTRIGAVDDLSQGQSTFLVEMIEATQCCLAATSRSLILLDEVGRGTSTYDGVAIAWAVAEYLASEVRARTVFATHYHELNGLANYFPQISNYQVEVAESEGSIEFLHRVVPGGASRSFGIHVASMAGLPKPIIDRAYQLMTKMERKSAASKILEGPKLCSISMDEVMQLSVFSPE